MTKKIFLYSIFSLFVFVCGVSFASTIFDNLSCLTKDRIASVRQAPSSAISVAFDACNSELIFKVAPLNLSAQQKENRILVYSCPLDGALWAKSLGYPQRSFE